MLLDSKLELELFLELRLLCFVCVLEIWKQFLSPWFTMQGSEKERSLSKAFKDQNKEPWSMIDKKKNPSVQQKILIIVSSC